MWRLPLNEFDVPALNVSDVAVTAERCQRLAQMFRVLRYFVLSATHPETPASWDPGAARERSALLAAIGS